MRWRPPHGDRRVLHPAVILDRIETPPMLTPYGQAARVNGVKLTLLTSLGDPT
jgi:hypothetical protein